MKSKKIVQKKTTKKIIKKTVKKISCICVKCKTSYESVNPDDVFGDGYCPNCFEERMLIAKQIDAKFGKRDANARGPRLSDMPSITVRGIQIFTSNQVGL